MNVYEKLQGLSPDALAKELWRGNDQFAELFNVFIYGKQQIKPESLQEIDTDLSMLIADKEFVKTIRGVRDIAKIVSNGTYYQILAIENQQAIHYAMPFRCLLYDMLSYYQQFKSIVAKNKKEQLTDKNEFLSGFKQADRFIPCRTIVLYYGEQKWNAAKNFSDLMEFTSEEDRLAFHDYSYELICMNDLDISNVEFHDKKTRDFFLYVISAYKNGGKEMPDELRSMDLDVAYIAATITGTIRTYGDKIIEGMKQGKETIDMCEAMQRALDERQQVGMEKGIEKGIEKGKYISLYELIRKNVLTLSQAAASMELSTDEFLAKLKEYQLEL